MDNQLFTVIMSVYNSSIFLNDSINSIINQNYKEFTFIICDDGSTDSSYEILLRWANKDSRIKLINHKIKMGLAYSLNECLKLVITPYVVRMDADDISEINRLKIIANFVKENNEYDIIGSNFSTMNEKNEIIKLTQKIIIKPTLFDILLNRSFCHPSTTIKTSFIRKLNGYFVDEKIFLYQDLDFWLRSAKSGAKMVNLNENLLIYRISKSSILKRNIKSKLAISRIKLRWANNNPFKILFVLPFILIDLVKGLFNEFRIILYKYL